MSTNETHGNERIDPRDERALTQYLTVLDDTGRARDAPGLYLVVSESGSEYLVDAVDGACECPDYIHRTPEDGCKHLRRVAFATGERPIPAEVDGIDEQLGLHVDAEPQRVATDGGSGIIDAGDDAVILDDESDDTDDGEGEGEVDERPDGCDCGAWNDGSRLPCWPCYRDGFREPGSADEE